MCVPSFASYKTQRDLSLFRRAVYRTVAAIPRGTIRTYGEVAVRAGYPRAARAVGTAMSENCFRDVPCHRVVRSDGTVGEYAFGGSLAKAARLRREGVKFAAGRVVFPK